MTALTRAGSTRRWRRLRLLVLDRDGWRCQLPVDGGGESDVALCGAWASHVDHITPRALGGTDDPANLRAACRACNLRRGARITTASPTGRNRLARRQAGWSW